MKKPVSLVWRKYHPAYQAGARAEHQRFRVFLTQVLAMRRMQVAYFKTRDADIMRESVRLEGEVDRALEALQSGDLFS